MLLAVRVNRGTLAAILLTFHQAAQPGYRTTEPVAAAYQTPAWTLDAPTLRERWTTARALASQEEKLASVLGVAQETAREILKSCPLGSFPSGGSSKRSAFLI